MPAIINLEYGEEYLNLLIKFKIIVIENTFVFLQLINLREKRGDFFTV